MFINVIWSWKITFMLYVLCTLGTYAELCEIHSTSPTCQHLLQMQLTLDDTVDPCVDFYGYACNNWRLANSGSLYDDVKGMLDYQINLKLITVMDKVEPHTLPLKILNETLIYYKSCLKAGNSNALRAYLELIKPGEDLDWPILQELEAYEKGRTNYSYNEWQAENFDHLTLIGKLWKYDINNILLGFDTSRDASFRLFTLISAPDFIELADLTEPIISNLLTDLGLPPPMALDYTKRITETHAYWSRHAQLHLSGYNDTYYGELKRKYPYFNKILENIEIHNFDDNDKIVHRHEQYLEFFLEHEKQPLNPVEKRSLCNYIMVMLLWQLQQKTSTGKSFNKLDCIKESRDKLDLPMHLLYYDYIYRPEEMHINADVQILYQKTRDYLKLALAKYLVGHNEILQELREHINRTALNMGNMPRSLFSSYFDKLYGDLPQMQANKFYCNQLNLLIHRKALELKDLNRTHYIGTHDDFTWVPTYDRNSKLIILPLVTLQPPIYHHTFDAIFKWSNLAYLFTDALIYSFLSSPVVANAYLSDMLKVEVAYQGYANEQKSKLQPDSTNISWKKIFLVNLAQFYCSKNGTYTHIRYSEFVRSIGFKFEHFAEAFQCGGKKEKPYCYE